MLFNVFAFLTLISLTIQDKSCKYGYVAVGGNRCKSLFVLVCEEQKVLKCIVSECGKTYYKPNVLRIVGGVSAVEHSFPSQVLLTQSYRTLHDFGDSIGIREASRNTLCAGVIINSLTVLTAAHCVLSKFDIEIDNKTFTVPVTPNEYYPTLESMFSIYVAASNISFLYRRVEPAPPTVKHTVKKIILHEDFDSINRLNDIALFILSKPLEFSKHIQPACLPDLKHGPFPDYNSQVLAAGWGALDETGLRTDSLQNVRLTNYDPVYCEDVKTRITDFDRELCAGEYLGGKDTCWGDSGGGLYVHEANRYIVAGLTSFGDGCARVRKPGVYTRVSYYLDWIMRNWSV